MAGLIIAAVGSFVLPRANEIYKGRREHLSGSAARLLVEIEAVAVLATEYWSKPYSSVSGCLEAQIQFKLELVSALMEVCSLLGGTRDGTVLLARLAAGITSATFATPTRVADPRQLQAANLAASALAAFVIAELGRFHTRWWIF